MKELRALWDAEIASRLSDAMQEHGYSRSGKGWSKWNDGKDVQAGVSFERTVLKNHVRVVCYADAWVASRKKDDFGWTTGTLVCDLPPIEHRIADAESLAASVQEIEEFVLNVALPKLEEVLTSSRREYDGVRTGRLDELGS